MRRRRTRALRRRRCAARPAAASRRPAPRRRRQRPGAEAGAAAMRSAISGTPGAGATCAGCRVAVRRPASVVAYSSGGREVAGERGQREDHRAPVLDQAGAQRRQRAAGTLDGYVDLRRLAGDRRAQVVQRQRARRAVGVVDRRLQRAQDQRGDVAAVGPARDRPPIGDRGLPDAVAGGRDGGVLLEGGRGRRDRHRAPISRRRRRAGARPRRSPRRRAAGSAARALRP